MMKNILITIFVLNISLSAFAKVVNDEVTWVNTNAFVKLSDKWLAYGEIQPRMIKKSEYLGVALYRAALGYQLFPKFSVWAGHGYIEWIHPVHFNEQRTFVQTITNHDFGRFQVSHRGRLEFRNLQDRGDSPVRVRYLVRTTYDLNYSGIHLVLWDEWFNHLRGANQSKSAKSSKPKPGFDQNRFFFGVGKKVVDPINLFAEIGYLNVFVDTHTSNLAISNGVAAQLTFRF